MKLFLLIILSFIVGSIPVGMIIARIKGVDLKKVGSGNIGATNVLRTMGKGSAIITLIGDITKGVIPVIAGKYFIGNIAMEGIIGLSAILGHNFSIFLGFRGGKGVATSIGVLLIYSPMAAIITIALWLITVLATRYSSLGAIISFGVLPICIYLFDYSTEKLITSIMITTLLILRHTANITRLINGTETKIGMRA